MHHGKKKTTTVAIGILSFLGILVSGYLIYQHFKPAGGSFCDINAVINCDIVNKSIYAEILGLPVSILGFAAYLVIFVMSMLLMRGSQNEKLLPLLACFTAGSFAFSAYLTGVEIFILKAACIMCLTSQTLILAIFILSTILWSWSRKSSSEHQ